MEVAAKEQGLKGSLETLDLKEYREFEKLVRQGVRINAKRYRKLLVLQQSNWRCIKCSSRRGLTIDHRSQLHDRKHKKNYKPDECAVLCRKCHMRKNGWVKENET